MPQIKRTGIRAVQRPSRRGTDNARLSSSRRLARTGRLISVGSRAPWVICHSDSRADARCFRAVSRNGRRRPSGESKGERKKGLGEECDGEQGDMGEGGGKGGNGIGTERRREERRGSLRRARDVISLSTGVGVNARGGSQLGRGRVHALCLDRTGSVIAFN